jgi:ADP-ribose pyrophosphatase YjhB (NUDIX family)
MKRYNVRAYALIIHEGKILLTDELLMGTRMSKFPGGGHEWGEGLMETIRRECMEELGQELISAEHFYTTDFFVASAFREEDQMISVYYKVVLPHPEKIETEEAVFKFKDEINGAQIFRWVALDKLTPDQLTYPIDKRVAELLRK